MERKKTIQELTSALKTLKLEEANLTTQLEEALKNNKTAVDQQEQAENNSKRRLHGFSKGDRVWSKNKLHKPASWDNKFEWIEREGKTATVTEVLIKGPTVQVHFVTDNGVKTWRAPNNLSLLAT
jgi:DUF438 domain-containing protein